ncbi:hypothetical protein ACWGI0_06895 [Streptomyces sp. NPDC054802]
MWAVNTTTPILRDTFTDADGDQVNGTFQVYDAATDTPITTPLGEGLILSPYGDQGKPVSVTVPTGQLKDGRTYKFRTNAYDGTHYNLNWSPWMFDTGVEPPPLPDGSKGEWQDQTGPFTSPKINVRCDKVKSYGTPGCVLKDYIPGYAFNAAKYPAAAAHAWLVQNKSVPNLLLGATPIRPLHFIPGDPTRVASGWDKENSRKVMCAKSRSKRTDGWVPNILFLNHPKTYLHPELAGTGTPDQVSCDEYPFASTYESPGMPAPEGLNPAGVGGGGECIQTVAAKVYDGTEHLLDDTRYDAPTWTEKCGRSSMSKYVNSGSMERMGVVGNPPFPKGMRLLDKDAFYVDPGNDWFDGCDATQDTVKCEMVKP